MDATVHLRSLTSHFYGFIYQECVSVIIRKTWQQTIMYVITASLPICSDLRSNTIWDAWTEVGFNRPSQSTNMAYPMYSTGLRHVRIYFTYTELFDHKTPIIYSSTYICTYSVTSINRHLPTVDTCSKTDTCAGNEQKIIPQLSNYTML